MDGPLTVVSAPPGFGKTTLLAQWAREDAKRTRFAWVTLGEDAQDPATLLCYVIEALRVIDPAIGHRALRRLGDVSGDPAGQAMASLGNDLERLEDRVVLVLDEFDVLQEPEARRSMTFLLRNLAGPLHVALATRSEPLLPLARFRAQGGLSELGSADLRFTAAEAGTLLRTRLRVEIGDDDLGGLLESTEGWPTGVYLAGMSRSKGDGRGAEFQ